jgi:hypothetical protein
LSLLSEKFAKNLYWLPLPQTVPGISIFCHASYAVRGGLCGVAAVVTRGGINQQLVDRTQMIGRIAGEYR